MTAVWEVVWARLERLFEDARLDLSRHVIGLRLDAARGSNTSFPFRAYASFGVDAEAEIVVVSVDVVDDEGRLRLTADIARRNGRVLAEIPERLVTHADADAAFIDAWVCEIAAFVRGNLKTLEAALLDESAGA